VVTKLPSLTAAMSFLVNPSSSHYGREMSRGDVKTFLSWLQHHPPCNEHHNSPAAVDDEASDGVHLLSPQVGCVKEGGKRGVEKPDSWEGGW